MGELSIAERHMEKHRKAAAKAFERHTITKRSEHRWLLQRAYEDGKLDWTMAAEVIALEEPAVYVGGDIDHVIFGYGPRDAVARLRWMGECKDLGYYVAQKARIGMGGRGDGDVTKAWILDVAEEEFKAHVAENADYYDGESPDDVWDRVGADDQREFLENYRDSFPDDDMEGIYNMGEVLAPRVIYAHAALARLCVLLRAEEAAEKPSSPPASSAPDPANKALQRGNQ
jgi:hypothetical protein